MSDHPHQARVWERVDLRFRATRDYANPYVDVELWVDLEGPGFAQRCYGFWDGDRDFVVRITPTRTGSWQWRSGSNVDDPGLAGTSGVLLASPWSGAELDANPLRRGMLRITPEGRALEHADGTPFFLLGDTWWSLPSFRFALRGDGEARPVGPDASLEDYVALRVSQGFNCVTVLCAHPAWADDGRPRRIQEKDGTWLRQGWMHPAREDQTKDMHNEGGRPFEFPGKVPGFEDVVPDLDRINPAYFRALDRRLDYLNDHGIVPFLEVSRRDIGQAWRKHHEWPLSYARYIQYVFARYQVHNAIFSPIHFDHWSATLRPREYNAPCNLVVDRWGKPPFGTLLSANCNPSTLVDFGGPDECRWLDVHQIGNSREHHTYWYLTEIFRASPARPAFNGEPYYAGLNRLSIPYPLRTTPDGVDDLRYVRSGMYGSFLSGGFAGHVYGAEAIWQADIEPEAPVKMWEAFLWKSADEMRHLRTFAEVRGTRYRSLIPESELVIPNKSGPPISYDGWSYCAHSSDRELFLIYFEAGAPKEAWLRGVRLHARYRLAWFDPRTGAWLPPGEPLTVGDDTLLVLTPRPDERDWGLLVELVEP